MFKRLLFLLSVIILLIGCGSEPVPTKSETFVTNESVDTVELDMTEIAVTKTEQDGWDEIPALLRKPELWGDTPNFTAVRMGGGDFQLSSLKGKVILLNFWSVGCSACKMQIPVLEQLHKKYNRDQLDVVGVCLERETVVQRFIRTVDMNYILVLLNQDMANKYGRDLRFIPVTFIIDQQGNIAEKHIGFVSVDVFEKEIKELLGKTEKR